MRPFLLNRYFPTRPITASEKRSARWSAGTSKTLRAAGTIDGLGARNLTAKAWRETLSANAGVRISAAAFAAFSVRLTDGQRGVSGRDRAKPRREPERSRQAAASAGGGRGAAKERARVSASVRSFPVIRTGREGGPRQRSAVRFPAPSDPESPRSCDRWIVAAGLVLLCHRGSSGRHRDDSSRDLREANLTRQREGELRPPHHKTQVCFITHSAESAL